MSAVIVNSAQRTALNPPTTYVLSSNTTLSGSPTTTTIAISPTISTGFIRVKIVNGGSASTAVTLNITATDGTATILIGQIPVAYTIANQADSGVDMTWPINADININSISLIDTLTVGTTSANISAEIWGSP